MGTEVPSSIRKKVSSSVRTCDQIDNVALVAAQKDFLFRYRFQDRGKLLA